VAIEGKRLGMNKNSERFYVITGGPGSGKTSLIEALRSRGYVCPAEAGRGVIQDQLTIEGRGLPWLDPLFFAELMLSWDMRSYREVEEASGPVFFDRGVADVMGYLRLVGIPVPEHIRNAAATFRYNSSVFVAPPWREIFHQDNERKQDFKEAVRTYEALVAMYRDLNYELHEIPRCSIEERVKFLLDRIKA
jgi:predicted ATPase